MKLVKGKYKLHPITCHEGTEGEQRCSYTLSLISAVDGQRRAPAALPSECNWFRVVRLIHNVYYMKTCSKRYHIVKGIDVSCWLSYVDF